MPPVDAYAMFLRTRSAVSAARYPDRLDYTISVAGLDGGTPRVNHYHASCRPYEGVLNVAPISHEEAAQPALTVHGVNFNLTAFICGGRCETGSAVIKHPTGQPPPSPDLIGVPLLAPTYMFGLSATATDTTNATESTLPVIAIVSTKSPSYKVALIDTPVVDGLPTYHLRLTALRNPKENRLRELWISINDYLPRKAVIAGNFTVAPLVDVPWTIIFTVINGAPFVTRETSDSTLYMAHRRTVENATISFEDIRESSSTIYDRPLIEPDAGTNALVEPST